MSDKLFSFEFHYGGAFKNIPLTYDGGQVAWCDKIDPDCLSLLDIQDIFEDCGCNKNSFCYYRIPMFEGDEGLKLLSTDAGVIEMFAVHQPFSLIKLFAVEEILKIDEIVAEHNFEDDYEDIIMQMLGEVEHDVVVQSDGNEVYEPVHDDDVEGVDGEAIVDDDVEVESIVETMYGQIDELKSLNGSSDEDDASSTAYSVGTNLGNKLKVGMKFASVVEFREALKFESLKGKFDLKYLKNDAGRLTAQCKENCGWRIHASKNLDEGYFQIKSFQSVHSCAGVSCNSQATSTFIANAYIDQLRVDPTWKTEAFKDAIARDFKTDISNHKIYRARKKALEIVEGEHGGQYSKLRDYCQMMLETNPGTITNISTLPVSEDSPPIFKRLFICFDAMRRGFKEGCRPFIGLDGCFLKHGFGGHLLSAVGVDGNDGIFPIAYAVVEAENRDSWTWFLNELMEAVGPYNGLTFMSDRQKGLVETFKDVLHGADHRYCVRHLYENFKMTYKGMKLKQSLWNAALSYNEPEFERWMKVIKDENKDAYEWLKKVNARLWARSSFTFTSKCGLCINNVCESFNGYIIKARDKPIIQMLEWIRKHVMVRFKDKREWMAKQNGLLCPAIQKQLEKIKDEARFCRVTYAGSGLYEIDYKGYTDAVNLESQSCSCRQWGVTGIPCRHAIAAIFTMRGVIEEYVDPIYHRETFIRAYSPLMHPMPMRNLRNLRNTGLRPILPPPYRKPPGRPKKARKRGPDEPTTSTRVSRSKPHLKCSRCQALGHNTRTCKATEATITNAAPPSRPGRPPLRRVEREIPPSRGGRGGMAVMGGRGGRAVLSCKGGRTVMGGRGGRAVLSDKSGQCSGNVE